MEAVIDAANMEFRILGPLEVIAHGRSLKLGGPKQRRLLALLVLDPGRVVSVDRLVEGLWNGRPPANAENALHVRVSNLRKLLGADAVVTRAPGYMLDVDADAIDAGRFERLAREGRLAFARGDTALAAERLRQALALWRGRPFEGVDGESFARHELQLDEARVEALEDRIDAELAVGSHAQLAGELEALVAEHPLRERLRRQLMLALYRSGRQADALEAYQDARRTLVGELGIEPDASLQELERTILNHDPRLEIDRRRADVRLPAPATPLVGRTAEIADATDMLRRPEVRVLTLTGPGGIGKTRLALEVASRLTDEFEDGVWFVGLAAVSDPTLLAPTLAKSLGLEPGGDARDRLENHLRHRSLLLVLDNFEQLLDAAPVLAGVLAASPGTKGLVTSRAVLRLSGERELPVPPLDRDAAVALFLQSADALDGTARDADAAAIEAICDRLDRLPLAIELAAARTRLLRPSALLERLRSRLDLLTGGPRDAPARQRTLRATIDWSHALLDEQEQGMFARVAVFVGGCTLEAAEAVCGEGAQTIDLLGSLLEKSLLYTHAGAEPRFAMLETVREYALERLEARGEADELRNRQLDYFGTFAEAAEPELLGPDAASWHERLEDDHDNFRAAVAWAIGSHNAARALRIGAALARFWYVRGYTVEGRRWLDAALAAGDEAPADVRAKALVAASALAVSQGRYRETIPLLEEGVGLYRNTGNEEGVIVALGLLARAVVALGDSRRTTSLLEEARDLAARRGDRRAEALAVSNLGATALTEGAYERGLALLEEASAVFRELGDSQQFGITEGNIGFALVHCGRFEDARRHLGASIESAHALGFKEEIVYGLEGMAAVEAGEGHAVRAARLLGASEELAERIGVTLDPFEHAMRERTVQTTRELLDEQRSE